MPKTIKYNGHPTVKFRLISAGNRAKRNAQVTVPGETLNELEAQGVNVNALHRRETTCVIAHGGLLIKFVPVEQPANPILDNI